jgi:hypothetical protein
MAITATTLNAAATSSQTFVSVTSATGITAPNNQTGSGITYLLVDQELMAVVSVSGTIIGVVRAINGSLAAAHVVNSQVQIGLPADFSAQVENVGTSTTVLQTIAGLNLPATFLAGSADAIPAGVAGFYVVKTAGVNAMTLAAPTLAQEGNIIEIASDTTNAHTLTATSLLANGTALKTTATFPAFRGACLRLRACNLVYHVLSNGASAGVVVLT